MAKLPALISALAEADGRERKAIDHIGRTIRERGYITTGKRGHGASEMTAQEAANLIIALNGADSATEAPIAIDRFRSLRQSFLGTSQDIRAHLDRYGEHPQFIKDIMDVHTFGEALEALIDNVPDIVMSLYKYMMAAFTQFDAVQLETLFINMIQLQIFGLKITFERYSAHIEVFTTVGSQKRTEFETHFVPDSDRLERGFYGKYNTDRRVSVSIGTVTLIAVWQALHPSERLRGVPDHLFSEIAEQSLDISTE